MARPVQLLSQYSLAGKAPDYVEINGAIPFFFISLQRGIPVFCNILINCKLHRVGFIASITQMGF